MRPRRPVTQRSASRPQKINAKSPTSRSKDLDANGQQVDDILMYLSRTTGTESPLDLTTVSHEIPHLCNWIVMESMMSDHDLLSPP
ncbi:hypothetical protein NPIL_468681 [Nephila pilipes]|uniref:Uncharacterized protein n=1 Tax=Nephila pilipes TaxID=299642 RepID=A0A8X6QQ07_NEPPI|nr:hypothetical protein NPIL_468681 [Nephila pilipes]